MKHARDKISVEYNSIFCKLLPKIILYKPVELFKPQFKVCVNKEMFRENALQFNLQFY